MVAVKGYRVLSLLISIAFLILSAGASYPVFAAASAAMPAADNALDSPDLVIEAIDWTPEIPVIGDTVSFTITISNLGSNQADPSTLDCYLDDTLLAVIEIDSLEPGTAITKSVPWTAEAGAHTFQAIADATQTIDEEDEANNAKSSAFSVLAPDLVTENISWSPESASVGKQVTFTVKVKNQGNARARPSRIFFYIDSASRGSQEIPGLDPGATAARTFTWITSDGSHTVDAVADGLNHVQESDESNNSQTKDYFTLAPDLVISSITQSPTSPSEGEEVTITVRIKNQGSGNSYPFHFACYLNDVDLDSGYVGAMNAGATVTKTFTWEAATGVHSFLAIADSGEEVAESDETNNTQTLSLSSLAPDLTVTGITWSPQSPLIAHRMHVTVSVKNQGKSQSPLCRLDFFIDKLQYHAYIEELAAGAETSKNFNWTALMGTHTLEAVIDAADSVPESNENNNRRTAKLSPSSPAPADLVLQDIAWSPQNPVAGDEITLTATVKNRGSGQAAWSNVAFYIDDAYLITVLVSPVGSGAQNTATCSWEAQAGPHQIKAIADSEQRLAETSENNNVRTEDFSIMAPDLIIDDITWSPANPSPGDEITFTMGITNRGNYAASPSYVGYYVNGSPGGQHYVSRLAVGASVSKTYRLAALAESFAFKAIADVENQVSESDESNNDRGITFPPPDLTISAITWTPEYPTGNASVVFRITLTNDGSGRTDASTAYLYLDDSRREQMIFPPLDGGGSATQTFTWTTAPGSHTFKVVADSTAQVIETDETNNEKTASISIANPTAPDSAPEALDTAAIPPATPVPPTKPPQQQLNVVSGIPDDQARVDQAIIDAFTGENKSILRITQGILENRWFPLAGIVSLVLLLIILFVLRAHRKAASADAGS
ncbi:CARDB domain-containing protein [Chloroflexota bacterium]